MAEPTPGEDAAPRFLFRDAAELETPVGRAINGDFLAEEERVVRALARAARLDEATAVEVHRTAVRLVEAVRAAPASKSGLDAFLRQYDLSSQEGVMLMCLAEALLRIPDADTADRADPRQARAPATGTSHLGDSRVAVRQRLDLGPDADRAHRAARSGRRRATPPARMRAPGRPHGRAGGAHRACARRCASWATSS